MAHILIHNILTPVYTRAQYYALYFFLFYMNDSPNVSKIFKFILYADDTTPFSTIEFSIPIHHSNVN